MKMSMRILFAALAASFVWGGASLFAAEQVEKKASLPLKVDFWKAKEEGLIDVKISQKNAFEGQLTIVNKSGRPLEVEKPYSFASVPLAQFDEFFSGDSGSGSSSSRSSRSSRSSSSSSSGSSGNQSSGGGYGNNSGGGRGGRSGGGSSWSVAPDKSIRESVKTVCLEHGKRDPNTSVKYEIRPITDVTDSNEVAVLCSLVGTGKVDQNAAQAAVWHLNNDMSWEDLTAKRNRTLGRPSTPYFNRDEIQLAQKTVERVEDFVKETGFDIVGEARKKELGSTSEVDANERSVFVATERVETLIRRDIEEAEEKAKAENEE